jgi:hypothetical protein
VRQERDGSHWRRKTFTNTNLGFCVRWGQSGATFNEIKATVEKSARFLREDSALFYSEKCHYLLFYFILN